MIYKLQTNYFLNNRNYENNNKNENKNYSVKKIVNKNNFK